VSIANIDRAVFALHKIAAKDDSRPVLARIFRNKGAFAAADGFIAASIQHDEEKRGAVPETLLIPAAAARQVKATARKPGVVMNVADETVTITAEANPAMVVSVEAGEKHATVPDIRGILRPSSVIPHAAFYVDALLLRTMADFLNTVTAGTNQVVEMRIFGADKAIEFRTKTEQESEVRAVLMPVVSGNRWMFDPVDGVERPSLCFSQRPYNSQKKEN